MDDSLARFKFHQDKQVPTAAERVKNLGFVLNPGHGLNRRFVQKEGVACIILAIRQNWR